MMKQFIQVKIILVVQKLYFIFFISHFFPQKFMLFLLIYETLLTIFNTDKMNGL